MLKQLVLNACISTTLLGVLFLLDNLSALFISGFFYSTPMFFFILYTIQALLLNTRQLSPQTFVFVYNFSTFIKLVLSTLFIISYHLLFAPHLGDDQKIYFSIFFLSMYFLYLITNTIIIFFNRNEKK
jgi:hypothetical protein